MSFCKKEEEQFSPTTVFETHCKIIKYCCYKHEKKMSYENLIVVAFICALKAAVPGN